MSLVFVLLPIKKKTQDCLCLYVCVCCMLCFICVCVSQRCYNGVKAHMKTHVVGFLPGSRRGSPELSDFTPLLWHKCRDIKEEDGRKTTHSYVCRLRD